MFNLAKKRKTVPKTTTAYSHNFTRPLLTKKFSVPIFLTLFILFLFGVYLIFFKTTVFTITRYNIKTDKDCLSEEEVRKKLKNFENNYFFASYTRLENELKKSYLCIDQILFKKIFPDAVEVTIKRRQKVATIKVVSASSLKPQIKVISATPSSQEATIPKKIEEATVSGSFLVDKNGVLYQEVNDDNFKPQILLADSSLKLGSQVGGDLIEKGLKVFKKFAEIGVELEKSEIVGESLYNNVKFLDKNILVIISLNKDLTKELAYLKLILQSSSQESKLLDRVDLRFDKPFVIYSAKKE